jgi:hypothetical protein
LNEDVEKSLLEFIEMVRSEEFSSIFGNTMLKKELDMLKKLMDRQE